jgi:ankyrin repeat protein
MAIDPSVWKPPARTQHLSLPDEIIRLACLDYQRWRPADLEKLADLLAAHPEAARHDLYVASALGDVAAVRAALDRQPDLVSERGGFFHWEPLIYACYSRVRPTGPQHSTLEVARVLLERGADPNAGFLWDGTYVFTALTGAFGRGEDWHNQVPHPQSRDLATLLLDAGADANDAQTMYNRHFQPDNEHLRLLFAYGLGCESNGPWYRHLGDRADSPAKMLVQDLCWAAEYGFLDRVKLLVEHGVNVNTPSHRTSRTAYQEALRAGRQRVGDYLLEHGATRIEPDVIEQFAQACIAGRADEARSRLAADPMLLHKLGHYGQVDLLHRAFRAYSLDGIRLIVELGVDINGLVPGTGLDRAVIHSAAATGVIPAAQFLIDLGADPTLRDPTYGADAIGWADHHGRREMVTFLKQVTGKT